MRIGSDVSWQFTPSGGIDEVRLWNVARTLTQIRDNMDNPITAPQGGLIAVWGFDGNTDDVVGSHDGSVQGADFLTFHVFYRMEVFDVVAGEQKIYFNYPGPPAPAVTDVNAFPTCP